MQLQLLLNALRERQALFVAGYHVGDHQHHQLRAVLLEGVCPEQAADHRDAAEHRHAGAAVALIDGGEAAHQQRPAVAQGEAGVEGALQDGGRAGDAGASLPRRLDSRLRGE